MALVVQQGRVQVHPRDALKAGAQSPPPGSPLDHDVALPDGVVADAFTLAYDSSGRPTPVGTEVTVAVRPATEACSTELACPCVALRAGGAIHLCLPGACP
jgi:hypothetical protein